MTREEFLMKKRNEMSGGYKENHRLFFKDPSTGKVEPFKIADNLYYVGDAYVCIHLIDTGDGLILIDSGYLGAEFLLFESIRHAGFDPADVKWIIHTHGHSDHYGASVAFRGMYGTKLAMSRVDAEILRKYPELSYDKMHFPYYEVPAFDREIEDGEIFELGNVKIECVLTPGHTDGVISLFFEVTYNGEKHLAGMFGGAGVNAISLPYIFRNKRSDDCPQDMLHSIEKVWDKPVTIQLGNHPGNNNTFGKRQKQIEEGGNPFIDPESWHNFLAGLKARTEKVIADNEALEKEISLL